MAIILKEQANNLWDVRTVFISRFGEVAYTNGIPQILQNLVRSFVDLSIKSFEARIRHTFCGYQIDQSS